MKQWVERVQFYTEMDNMPRNFLWSMFYQNNCTDMSPLILCTVTNHLPNYIIHVRKIIIQIWGSHKIEVMVFWVVTPCHRFGGSYGLHLQYYTASQPTWPWLKKFYTWSQLLNSLHANAVRPTNNSLLFLSLCFPFIVSFFISISLFLFFFLSLTSFLSILSRSFSIYFF